MGVHITNNGREYHSPADSFAYDGCHKIYLIESAQDMEEARTAGYEIHPIDELTDCYFGSCGLEFVNNWSLTKTYVEQFAEHDSVDFCTY